MTDDDTDIAELDEQRVRHAIDTAAATGRQGYRQHLPYADAKQAATLWVYAHPGKVRELLDDGDRGARRLTWLATRAVEVEGRRERAAALGYNPEDEAFYDRGMVELILPALWDEEYKPWADKDKAGRRRKADPSQGNEWAVMVADVRKAWGLSGMSDERREALTYRFRDHEPYAVIAARQGCHINTVQSRLHAGLASLVEALGGFDPHCSEGCECGLGGPGSRRVMSTAHSLAVQQGYYSE
jgi:hypothetical protein